MPAALITGTSTGIGHVTAEAAAAQRMARIRHDARI